MDPIPQAKTRIKFALDLYPLQSQKWRLFPVDIVAATFFRDTPYWDTVRKVCFEVKILYRQLLEDLYFECKHPESKLINETNEHLFIRLRGQLYKAERAFFISRDVERDYKTDLDGWEDKAKHGIDMIDEFLDELRRPPECEDGTAKATDQQRTDVVAMSAGKRKRGEMPEAGAKLATQVMDQQETDFVALTAKKRGKVPEVGDEVADKTRETAEAEDRAEKGNEVFKTERALFDHMLELIERFRKEIGEPRLDEQRVADLTLEDVEMT